MAIKFYKLLDLLNKREMSKGGLQKKAGFSSATMAKISANESVSLDVINRICAALRTQPGDIMEYVPEEPTERTDA